MVCVFCDLSSKIGQWPIYLLDGQSNISVWPVSMCMYMQYENTHRKEKIYIYIFI